MKNYSILLFTLLIFVFSCKDDFLMDNDSVNETQIIPSKIVDGRMFFENKASLQHYFKKYSDDPNEELAKFMEPYYKSGFMSLIPFCTEENENLIYEQIKKRSNINSSNKKSKNKNGDDSSSNTEDIADHIDDLEEIIGSEAYAAFLNSEAEIQVANKIYKYTDCGLFIVDANKYSLLEVYLNNNNISNNLLNSTEESTVLNYVNSAPKGAVTTVSNGIEYFIPNENPHDPNGSGGTGGSDYSNAMVAMNVGSDVQNFVNNLPNCNPRPFTIGSLFGDNKVCIDRYENKRRVKTKAWNLNLLLVYHIGVKVKHQFKGWTGIWRTEQTKEVGMGVAYAQFTYDYTNVVFGNYINFNNYLITTGNNLRLRYDYPTYLGMQAFNTNQYPTIFRDDIVIEIFRNGNSTWDNLINSAVTLGNKQLTSENLNKQFWNELWDRTNSMLENANQSNSISNNRTLLSKPTSPTVILVQKSLKNHAQNIAIREKTFDWGFEIALGLDNNGELDFSDLADPDYIVRPTNYKVSMYGISRGYDGVLHGSKLEF